VRLRWWWWNCY